MGLVRSTRGTRPEDPVASVAEGDPKGLDDNNSWLESSDDESIGSDCSKSLSRGEFRAKGEDPDRLARVHGPAPPPALARQPGARRMRRWGADVKSACLQGQQDDSRPEKIYMRPPRDRLAGRAVPEWEDKKCVYELLSGIYGRVDAPRLWFLEVKERYPQAGWKQHSLNACVFLYWVDQRLQGIVEIHVDDGLMADHMCATAAPMSR